MQSERKTQLSFSRSKRQFISEFQMIRDPFDPGNILNEHFQGLALIIVDNHTPQLNFTVRHNDINDSTRRQAFFPTRSEDVVVNTLADVDGLIELALHRCKEFGL
jgi:hypothetical protein